MKFVSKIVATSVALGCFGIGTARAADFLPAIVYDIGGKFDKSFNEAAYHGAERFKAEAKTNYIEFEVKQEAQREQAFRNLAKKGASIIVAMSFAQASAVKTIATEFPNIKFTIIDDVVDLPNVQSVVYKEQEGSFLVGIAATLTSKTQKLGFVGGMDIPIIRAFGCGYAQGAKYTNKNAEVFQNMVGTTGAAWTDPTRGGEIARSQFDRGADVVFAAAGATGLGVLQAAKEKSKLSIGVDSNQDGVQPGSVLTSMVKRVDLAVYNAFKTAKDGTWKAGKQVLGVKEEGVGYTVDEYNKPILKADVIAQLEAAKADIISGKLEVVDYRANNTCPVQ